MENERFKSANFRRFTKHAQSAHLRWSHTWRGWETSWWLNNKAMWVGYSASLSNENSHRSLRTNIGYALLNSAHKHLDLAGQSSIFSQTRHHPPLPEKNRAWIYVWSSQLPASIQFIVRLKVDRACDSPSALDFCWNWSFITANPVRFSVTSLDWDCRRESVQRHRYSRSHYRSFSLGLQRRFWLCRPFHPLTSSIIEIRHRDGTVCIYYYLTSIYRVVKYYG